MAEIKTVSGSVVTFDDAESGALESLTTQIVATQEGSGAPSPSNIRPISGFDSIKIHRTGKNMLNGEDAKDYALASFNNSTSGENETGKYYTLMAGYPINKVNMFPWLRFKDNTQYTFIVKIAKDATSTSTNLRFAYSDGTYSNINRTSTSSDITEAEILVVTSRANKTLIGITGFFASGRTYIYYEHMGVFEGVVTADDYEAYNGTSVEVQLGQTVYGGSLNVTTGELTITHWGDTFTGDSVTSVSNVDGNQYARVLGSYMSTGVRADMLCDRYRSQVNASDGNIIWMSATQQVVRIFDDRFTDLATAKSILDSEPVLLVYPLANPITVQLSATEVMAIAGTNTIWSDSGDVEVSYRVYEEREDIFDGRTMNFQYRGSIAFKHNQSWGQKWRLFNNNSISSESIEITESLYDPQNFRIGGGILPQLKIRFFKENIDFSDVVGLSLIVVPFDNPNYRFVYTNSNMTEQEVIDISTGEVVPVSEYVTDEITCGTWAVSDFSVSSDGKFVDVTAAKDLAFDTEEKTGFNAWYDNLYDSQNNVAIKDLMNFWWNIYYNIGDPDTERYVNRNIAVSKCFQAYPGIRNFVVWLAELNGVYILQKFGDGTGECSDIVYDIGSSSKEYTSYQGGSLVYNGYKTITKLVIVDSSRGFRWETGNNDGLVYTITEESNPLIKGIALNDLPTMGTNLFNVISNKPFYDISFVAHGDYTINVGDNATITVDDEEIDFVVTNRTITGCQHLIDEISSSIPSVVENGQITSGEVEASYRNYVLYQNNLTDGDVKYLTDGDYLIRTTRVTNLPDTGTTEGFYLIKRTAMNGNAYMLCYGFSTQKLYVGSYNSTNDTLTWIECATDISGKQDVITGAITPYLQANATADRIIASDANGKLTVSAVGAQALYSAINNISGLTGGKIVVTSSAGGSFVTSTIDASDLFSLYTNITGLTGGNRVVLTSSAGGSLITSSVTGTDLSNAINHVNNDLSTGYSMLSLADGNIASSTSFNFSRQFVIPKAGLYYVHALARWSANATGTRVLAIHSSGTQEVLDDNSIYMFTSNMASPGNMTFIQHLTGLLRVTSDNKYFWIRGWQNSGSTLGTNFRVQFVKLTDSTSVIT